MTVCFTLIPTSIANTRWVGRRGPHSGVDPQGKVRNAESEGGSSAYLILSEP